MTRGEFAKVMAYLTAGCGVPLAVASVEVYYDLLRDLPADVLLTAAKRVLIEHVWKTFPSIAELRAASVETAQGVVNKLGADEAWALAWKAACSYDPGENRAFVAKHKNGGWRLYESKLAYLCESLPPLVVKAWRHFGFAALANADATFARKEFFRIYEGLLERENRHALLPASVQEDIAAIGASRAVRQITEKVAVAIGCEKGHA